MLEIHQSQVMKAKGVSNDAGLEKELLDRCGPFISKLDRQGRSRRSVSAVRPAGGPSISRSGSPDPPLLLTQQQGHSLWATVHRLIDESQHNCVGQYDPASPFYVASDAQRFGDVMRECYRVLDRTMGLIIRRHG